MPPLMLPVHFRQWNVGPFPHTAEPPEGDRRHPDLAEEPRRRGEVHLAEGTVADEGDYGSVDQEGEFHVPFPPVGSGPTSSTVSEKSLTPAIRSSKAFTACRDSITAGTPSSVDSLRPKRIQPSVSATVFPA